MNSELRALRKTILETSYLGHDGNLQSVFSSMEILWTLYDKVLNISPELCNDPNRDYFILSKGQSTLGLIVILAEKGFINQEELKTFCQLNSRISMQADRTKLPGVEISAGSLGHGFPIATGIAWGNRIKGRNNKVYVLVGDGEMNEGTMWEAALFASSEKLNNLTVIVDDNSSLSKMLNIGDLGKKFEAFDFTISLINGHDEEAITKALKIESNKPKAIIASTKRGYGSNTLIEDLSWFHRAPNQLELAMLKREVDEF